MSWQADIDAWLLSQGMVTQHPCGGCDCPIKPGDPTVAMKDGSLKHRLCFDLQVAALEADLGTVINEENGWTKRVAENGRELWTPPTTAGEEGRG